MKQINTRVISDPVYWDMFSQYNKENAAKVINFCFDLDENDCNSLNEILSWLYDNTTGLVYVSETSQDIFFTRERTTKIFMELSDDAMNFKLRWMS